MPISNPSTRALRVGDRVRCVVEGIFPFGVFVQLEDSQPGYIRLRELSLAGDARGLKQFELGQSIWAVVTELPGERTHYGLSHRLTLNDPWERFVARHKEDDLVSGTIRALSKEDATVEIVPGVRARLPLRELASWDVGEPKDLLWLEDQVQAKITRLQSKPPRMTLSIRRLLERPAAAGCILPGGQSAQVDPLPEALLPPPDAAPALPLPPVYLTAPVLLVDDTSQLRRKLAERLGQFGCTVEEAASGAEALALARQNRYALLIADLDMPDMDGVQLISTLRGAGVELPVAVMSDPGFILANAPRLLELNIAAALAKPLEMEEVHALLQKLVRGEPPRLNQADWVQAPPKPAAAAPAPVAAPPGAPALGADGPVAVRLQKVLEDAVRSTAATNGFIFRLDPISLQIEVTASAPPMWIAPEILYALRESPVKDVIVDDQSVLEGSVMSNDLQSRRFAKLLLLMPFESCLAVPLRAGGQVDSALFLFHRAPGVFNIYRQRDAHAAATLMSALLQNEALERRMRDLSGLLLSGQLAAGFGHEVHNKLAILNLQFEHLEAQVDRLLAAPEEDAGAGAAPVPAGSSSAAGSNVATALNAALAASAELQRTVRDFRKLMGPRQNELVDVNEVARQAEALMRPIARRSQVALKLDLAAELPRVQGSALGLQQVILNLLLNAVEHTGAKQDPTRVVTVSTGCVQAAAGGRVEIRVQDTGPGIHRRLWEKVFELGFTTRGSEGSGLGLFIARSLLNPMGGQIAIESSYVPLGTTFLVTLLAAVQAIRQG